MWFLSTGGRGCSHRTGSAVLPVAPDCNARLSISAFDTSIPSWIAVLGAMILHSALWAEVSTQPFHTRESCLMGWVWGLFMKHPVSKWNSTQRKRSNKRLDFILLPRFYYYFQGIVDGLCWWLFHHSPASWNIKGPDLPLMTVSFVTCRDNTDKEKETNFSSVPEDPKGKVLI